MASATSGGKKGAPAKAVDAMPPQEIELRLLKKDNIWQVNSAAASKTSPTAPDLSKNGGAQPP